VVHNAGWAISVLRPNQRLGSSQAAVSPMPTATAAATRPTSGRSGGAPARARSGSSASRMSGSRMALSMSETLWVPAITAVAAINAATAGARERSGRGRHSSEVVAPSTTAAAFAATSSAQAPRPYISLTT
jgi:hypothetical protein